MVVSSRIEFSVFWASSHASSCFLYSLRCSAIEPDSESSVSNNSCYKLMFKVCFCVLCACYLVEGLDEETVNVQFNVVDEEIHDGLRHLVLNVFTHDEKVLFDESFHN